MLAGDRREIWGIKRVGAETTPDNFRMIAIFGNRGFTIK